ncbi:hypothetical protein EXIGLDRAFT_753747 [Exidia glandulosa HHB12029]|uniref:Aprataxin and PNK-like factor PBZ domain-containing protein n=1 Tax=Exidia glandulosa HHB12029 TaxID=1314781 RepID=A0A165DIH9_EXIGL|nr:hypothetical protein EXIGLDRAFT_753747 [Exidia glandulosa HHB12029]
MHRKHLSHGSRPTFCCEHIGSGGEQPLWRAVRRTADSASTGAPWTSTFIMPCLQRLPVELHDEVLKAIDDFATLRVAILSYKRFYLIYKAHPEIIERRVLENSLGPEVLDAALRSIRIPAWMPTCHHTNIRDIVEIVCTDFHENKMGQQRITDAEYSLLFDHALVCDELEVVFSRWYKDRLTDRKSLLTPAERKAFRMCIHRLWLLSSFAGKDSIVLDAIRDLAVRQQLFYDSYTSQDVYNLHSVIYWMFELVHECLMLSDDAVLDFIRMKCIVGGPDVVFRIYEYPGASWELLEQVEGLVDADPGGWKADLRHIFENRKLSSPGAPEVEIPSHIVPLVVLPEESDFECSHCHMRYGVRLWNEANWEHVPRQYRLETLSEWFLGHLKDNVHERLLLLHFFGIPESRNPYGDDTRAYTQCIAHADAKALLKPAPDDMTVPRVLRELCELPAFVDTDEHVAYLQQNEFRGVTASDLLCKRCLGEMVEARLWVWWLIVKELSFKELSVPGQATSEDCRYGLDCRKQTSDPEHVLRFNHVCLNAWPELKRLKKRKERRKLEEATRASSESDDSADAGAPSTDEDQTAPTPIPSATTSTRRRYSV